MKKLGKKIMGFAGDSMMLGAASMAAAPFGGNAGLASMSSFMPTIGTTMMAGEEIRMVYGLIPKRRR